MFNFHWLTLRLAALITFFSILFDIEISFFILGFLFLHMSLGLQTVMTDYVHVKKMVLVSSLLIRVSSIEVLRCCLELLI